MADQKHLGKLMGSDKNEVLSADDIASTKKSIQIICYNRKDGEDYADARIRIYTNKKTKTSQLLPPDKYSSKKL